MKWFTTFLAITSSFYITWTTSYTVTTTTTTTTTVLHTSTRSIQSMKRQLLLFSNPTHYHPQRLWYHSTTDSLRSFRPPGTFPPIDGERLIREGEQRENERDNIPTSLEDIPHWTKRPIAKQQNKRKVAQVDNETYWREAFAPKDEQYYRDYFNFGFIARGTFTVQIPVQYTGEPTFLPRQWKSERSPSLSSSSTTTTKNHQYSETYRPHPQLSLQMSQESSPPIDKHDNDELVISNSDSSTLNSNVDVQEQAESTPAEDKLRIVDVDCNLWHKDLLLLLLPQLSAPSNGTSVSDHTDAEPNTTDVEIPDWLQILRNDDLSPVVAMITPSSTIAEAAKGIDLLKRARHTNNHRHVPYNIRLRTTVGVHPYNVPDLFHNYHDSNDGDHEDLAVSDVASTIDEAKCLLDDVDNKDWICAIGECGLDTTTGFPPIAYQIPYFTAQIELANEYRLPLFVHERNAHDTLIDLLDEYADPDRIPNIIIHCFTGNVLHCETYIKRGYYLSISGFVFRDREASQVQACLEHDMIPLDRLMIETDSPYMGFTGCRELFIEKNRQAVNAPHLTSKQRKVYSIKQNYPNPPSSIIMVLHQVLHHINIGRTNRNEPLLTVQELADVTTRNADAFFGLGL